MSDVYRPSFYPPAGFQIGPHVTGGSGGSSNINPGIVAPKTGDDVPIAPEVYSNINWVANTLYANSAEGAKILSDIDRAFSDGKVSTKEMGLVLSMIFELIVRLAKQGLENTAGISATAASLSNMMTAIKEGGLMPGMSGVGDAAIGIAKTLIHLPTALVPLGFLIASGPVKASAGWALQSTSNATLVQEQMFLAGEKPSIDADATVDYAYYLEPLRPLSVSLCPGEAVTVPSGYKFKSGISFDNSGAAVAIADLTALPSSPVPADFFYSITFEYDTASALANGELSLVRRQMTSPTVAKVTAAAVPHEQALVVGVRQAYRNAISATEGVIALGAAGAHLFGPKAGTVAQVLVSALQGFFGKTGGLVIRR